jgi:pseudouridine-5'-monophosphatase
VKIAVATTSDKRSFDFKTENHQEFFNLFDHIVLGDDPELENGKPAPDIYELAAKRFSDSPKYENVKNYFFKIINFINYYFQCLVFEDSPNGVKAGIAANMQVVMVPNPNTSKELTTEATKVISSLLDFKPEEFKLPKYD